MSFSRFRKKTVSERIYEAHNNPSTNNVGNVVRIMTFGISKFYEVIDQKAKWNTSNGDNGMDNGFLIINNPNTKPVLFNKRYIHEKLLATGTFAQIHLFVDTFMNRKVAIKITKVNCDLLSWREKAFLDHVATCEKRGLVLFAQVKDIFVHENHVCLVMPFYQGTLMDFLYEGVKSVNPVQQGTYSQFSSPTKKYQSMLSDGIATESNPFHEVLRPRAMRSSVTPMASKPPMPFSNSKVTFSKSNVPQRDFSMNDLVVLKRITIQLLSALWVLHKEEIIHGDLKPENCFVDLSFVTNGYHVSSGSVRAASRAGSVAASFMSPFIGASSPSQLAQIHLIDGTSEEQSMKSSQQNDRSVQLSNIHINTFQNISTSRSLSTFPNDAKVKLGDFGNSLHVSELPQYFVDFEIQSLPYRAPEVLLGLRFNSNIDVWSLGIVLLELIIGETLFHGNSREDAIRDIEINICKLSKTRFSSGKFAHCLFQAARSQGSNSSSISSNLETSQWNRLEQTKSIKRLLQKHVSASSIPQHEWNMMIDLLTGLTAVDPSHRLSPFEALQHNFLIDEINIPMGIVSQAVQISEDCAASISATGGSVTATRALKRRRVGTGASLFHSLKNF